MKAIHFLSILCIVQFLFTSCGETAKKGEGKNGIILPKKDTSALEKVAINLEGSASKEKVLLQFNPEKGSRKTMALTMKSIFGKDVLRMTLTTEMQTLDVLPNGDVNTRMKIMDIQAKTNGSEINTETRKQLEPLLNGYSYATYSRLGKVLSMKADNAQLDAQFKSNQSNGFMPEFPTNPLGIGDSWKQTNKQVVQQEEITIQCTYFVRSINPTSVALELKATVYNKEKSIFTIDGMVETDRKTGFPIKGNLEQKVKGMGTNFVSLVVQ